MTVLVCSQQAVGGVSTHIKSHTHKQRATTKGRNLPMTESMKVQLGIHMDRKIQGVDKIISLRIDYLRDKKSAVIYILQRLFKNNA